jgi:hypothetical protein
MPNYKFHVQDHTKFEDRSGTDLPNDQSALAEGAKVAREVKSSNNLDAAQWSVEIKDGTRVVDDIPLNAVD